MLTGGYAQEVSSRQSPLPYGSRRLCLGIKVPTLHTRTRRIRIRPVDDGRSDACGGGDVDVLACRSGGPWVPRRSSSRAGGTCTDRCRDPGLSEYTRCASARCSRARQPAAALSTRSQVHSNNQSIIIIIIIIIIIDIFRVA